MHCTDAAPVHPPAPAAAQSIPVAVATTALFNVALVVTTASDAADVVATVADATAAVASDATVIVTWIYTFCRNYLDIVIKDAATEHVPGLLSTTPSRLVEVFRPILVSNRRYAGRSKYINMLCG